ncbi:MAG TPA: DUF4388 domain-containing protein [Ktedonobacterales bacterium]
MDGQGRILDGDLETLGLQATLKMLALGGHTGILSVESGQERLRIALQGGNIVALEEPGALAPDLIEIFRLQRRLDRLTRDEIRQLRQVSGNNPITVMLILEQRGLLPSAEVQRRIEFSIVHAVSRAIRWERGRFEFQKDITPIQTRIASHKPHNVDHVLLEALRLADERDHSRSLRISRGVVPRWMPQFQGDISQLGLSQDEVSVLCLANGQLPLSSICYGLMLPEAQVAAIVERLLQLGLIELVDARLEADLEHSLATLLAQSQHQLSQQGRASPEQRMLMLIRTLGSCVNGLLAHHAVYARALRGRGEVSREEQNQYIEATFAPWLLRMQRDYPHMDGIIRFEQGQLHYAEVEALDRVVRGKELTDCYWDAVQLLFHFTGQIFQYVLADEAGHSRTGRQFEDLWAAFLREIDEEIRRLAVRHVPMRT